MTREKQIEILMKDGYTEREAKDALERGCTIYDNLEEHLDEYLEEFKTYMDSEIAEKIRCLVEKQEEFEDWSIVKLDGKRYYIMHVN